MKNTACSDGLQELQLYVFFIELCIPDSSNVFYAMNSSMKEYHFALLEDGSQIKPAM